MSAIPFLIIGLGLFYSLLLFAAKDNAVHRPRVAAIAAKIADGVRAFTRSMDNLATASAKMATSFAQLGKSMAEFTKAARPRLDRVIVADRESLHRLTRDIGAHRAPAPGPGMLPPALLGIPVVISPEVESGFAILMRDGKQVGRIDLSHYAGDPGGPQFENGWENKSE